MCTEKSITQQHLYNKKIIKWSYKAYIHTTNDLDNATACSCSWNLRGFRHDIEKYMLCLYYYYM